MPLIYNPKYTIKTGATIIVFPDSISPNGDGATKIDSSGKKYYEWTALDSSDYLIDWSLKDGAASMQGGAGADTLSGTRYNDTISGGGGNDSLATRQGNDVVSGEDGDDTILTWQTETGFFDGGDTIDGGAGDDTISAAGSNNKIYGGADNDVIEVVSGNGNSIDAGIGSDTIVSVGNSNIIYGDSENNDNIGADYILSRGDSVTIYGFGGFDTIHAAGQNVTISAGAGDDRVFLGRSADGNLPALDFSGIVTGNDGNDLIDGSAVLTGKLDLNGGAGFDSLIGGQGNDTLDGGLGNDNVKGGAGDDRAIWNWDAGVDTYDGEGGYDTLVINFRSWTEFSAQAKDYESVTKAFSTGSQATVSGKVGNLTYRNFEYLAVVVGGTTVWEGPKSAGNGPPSANVGQPGPTESDDTIFVYRVGDSQKDLNWTDGLGGNDMIFMSGKGDAFLSAFEGKTFSGGAGNDTMLGLDRSDRLDGGEGDDYILGGAGNDTLTAGAGNDTVDGGIANDVLAHAVADYNWDGSPGGGAQFTGGGGNDTIYAAAGDRADGGDGNDRLCLGDGVVSASGGSGNDLIMSVRVNKDGTLPVAVSALTADGLGSHATSGDKTIDGGSGSDTLVGGGGRDVIDGGAQNDGIWGGDDGDFLTGGTGSDTLYGGNGDDTIDGGFDADSLYGGAGNDEFRISRDFYVEKDYYFEFSGNGARSYVLQADKVLNITASRDYYSGGDGTDTLLGTDARDAIFVTMERYIDGTLTKTNHIDGIEVFDMGGGEDVADLRGLGNAATLAGRKGHDVLLGTDKDDTIYGGSGEDTMSGGDGNDRFVFSTQKSSGFRGSKTYTNDLIVDFKLGDGIWFTKAADDDDVGVSAFSDAATMLTKANWSTYVRTYDRSAANVDDTILYLRSGDTITLAGVSVASAFGFTPTQPK